VRSGNDKLIAAPNQGEERALGAVLRNTLEVISGFHIPDMTEEYLRFF
jgi:hypothetical protein